MQRTIEPDPDSTTSDISVLDEMDEYLDECLALQGVGEEGPTPPKLNRAGKSPSAASHSFKYKQGYNFYYFINKIKKKPNNTLTYGSKHYKKFF